MRGVGTKVGTVTLVFADAEKRDAPELKGGKPPKRMSKPRAFVDARPSRRSTALKK
jgi:hypothetical protein